MWLDEYRWHYDYVRLAWDTGFTFEKYKHPNLDKNKISLIDIDRIVRERDVASVERNISTVVQYILDNDQAEVLDSNFVKLFRISQLSVEYLIFCKKYLDNTVVLLKKDIMNMAEQIKESKLYIEELEAHISELTKHNNIIATYKCDKCPKCFSTEQYLSSHLKRRHNEENPVAANGDTDKLYSEIKELKERLNITEKVIQTKPSNEVDSKISTHSNVEGNETVLQIQKQFEVFREKVENEISDLHREKSFYEEKYSKLFDTMLEYRKNTRSDIKEDGDKEIEKERKPVESPVLKNKTESCTQTEKNNITQLQIETIQNKNTYDFKDISNSVEDSPEEKDDLSDKINEKIGVLGNNIESKISAGLHNIENQMQAFWEKLKEQEVNKIETLKDLEHPKEIAPKLMSDEVKVKPRIKPRTKFSKPTSIAREENLTDAMNIKMELEKMISKPTEPQVIVMPTLENNNHETLSKLDSNSMTEEASSTDDEHKFIKNDIPKRSIPSNKKISYVRDEEVLDRIREEITNLVNSKLQEIGISPSWKGIPKATFERTLEMVEHQGNLNKRKIADFEHIKKCIEKSLSNARHLIPKSKAAAKSKSVQDKRKGKPNVIRIGYTHKTDKKVPEAESVVTIRNRSLYESDTESEKGKVGKRSIEKIKSVQAAVIEELKSVHSKSSPTRPVDTDSDLYSEILPNDDKDEVLTKSVLKSFPSEGSLSKKKVMFDVETHNTNNRLADGNESTSLSSVLNEEGMQKHRKHTEDNSLSDFESIEI